MNTKYCTCIQCSEPFTSANVFTIAGAKETQISGLCEKCFDSLFEEIEEEGDSEQI